MTLRSALLTILPQHSTKNGLNIKEASAEDVDKAVKAARAAFELGSPWRTKDASARGHLLHKLADLIDRDVAELATLETMDVGKPFAWAVSDVKGAAGVLRYYAGFADKIHGKTIPIDGDFFSYTRIEPVGVVGAIIPVHA